MTPDSAIQRVTALLYGIACYILFFGVFLYAIAFMGNFLVPNTLDSPSDGPWTAALLVNGLLLTLFAVQHSGMARPTFKRWWRTVVPKPIERSTYVLFTNVVMILIFWLWHPMGGVVWRIDNQVLRGVVYVLFGIGWVLVFYATLLINHFDLFGLRQVWLYFRKTPYTQIDFRIPSLYRYVRHPLYVGWITVLWAAPTMTVSHLLFAAVTTAYILIAIQLEERNLVDFLPGYAEYRKRVPMLVPSLVRSTESDGSDSARSE